METNVMHRAVSGAKGGKGGGGGGRVAQEAPNTLQSKSTFRVIEILSEGEIVGLADGAKSVYLDDTPLQNADGSYNFEGVAFQTRVGLPDQSHVEGFPSVEDEVVVSTKVTYAAPVVRTVTDADTDAIRVTIRLNALTEQNTSNGDLNGSSVSFKIEYQPNGGSYIEAVSPTQGTITGKTVSAYERQYRINLTGSAPWNVRVTRITPDSVVTAIQNDIYWSAYTRVLDEKLIYPDSALIAMEVDSSLFGSSLPQRSYDVIGKIIKIPDNYDPETRVYTGVWAGTFQDAWSDNPAWILYDIITNERYGLGEYIDAAEVDKYALYTIGQYCDEMVDDGAGGLEPRYRLNCYLPTQEEALRVLQIIASVFRGMVYWGEGTITAVHDAPADPIKLFTPANVKDGIFTYSTAAAEAQHSAVYVTWNNPEDGHLPAVEVVESPTLFDSRNSRRAGVVAFGATSRGQANRFGAWMLDTEQNANEMIKFTVGLGDADARPGDVVKIQDPAYADIRFGGRLLSATTTALTIDSPIEIESGQTYLVDVVLPDATIETRTLTNSVGTATVLTLDSALSGTPEPMAMWIVTSTDVAPRQFRIITVRETTPAEFDVTAILHDPTKYARIESGIYLPTTSFSKLEKGYIAPPSNIAITEYLVNSGAYFRSAATISWEASPDSRVVIYELSIKRPGNGNNYEIVRQTSGLSHVLEATFDGLWSFRVRAFDALGTPSTYALQENYTLDINSRAPDDVADLSITNLVNTSVLTWSPVTSRNISHYELRYSSDLVSATWNGSITVAERIPKDATSVVVASRTGTFLIKAVSLPTENYTSGVYSVNSNNVSTNIDFLSNYNYVADLIEDPTFSGTKTNCVVNAGNLELDEVSPGVFEATGTYEFSSIIDLGAVYTCRVTPRIVVAGNLATNDVDTWTDVDAIVNVDGTTDGLWAVDQQVSFTTDDPTGSPTWSAWRSLDVGDISAWGFKFRTLLYSYNTSVTPSIEELSVQIDMPDIIQSGEDISSLSTGDLTVTFPFEYESARPAVVITPQNMATGDYYTVSNITGAGFDISIYNSAGTRVVRTFDYHTKGYGRVTP